MNANLPIRFTLLIAALTLTTLSPALAAGRPPALRYQFREPVTNIYSVRIETQNEGNTDILEGNLTAVSKSVSSNIMSLTLRGSLTPRHDTSSPRTIPGPFNAYPRWLSPVSLNESCEIQFDPSGHVLRISGDYPLPIPFGSIAQLFLESFPTRTENRWTVAENLTVLDEPLNLGPAISFQPPSLGSSPYTYYGPFSSRNTQGALPVTRSTRYQMKSSTPQLITVTKQMDLASRLQLGNEPRISATASGDVAFDRNGILQRAELQTKTTSNSDTLTRRTAGSLQMKLLKDAELEAALKPATVQGIQTPATNFEVRVRERILAATANSKKPTAEEIQQIMVDLKSTETTKRSSAASKLTSADLSDAPPGLLDLAATLVDDEDYSVRNAAIRVITEYGTAEQAPILLKLLKDPENSNNYSVIRTLGRLKDKRAIEPLVALVVSGDSAASQAADALAKIGPDAEDAVLPLLKEKHKDTRRQACKILKQIGTAKSLGPLRDLTFDSDRMLSQAAAEAGRAIQARQ